MANANIVKRRDKLGEPYSSHKLSRSIVAACNVVATPIGAAEDIAKIIVNRVESWLENKMEVTSLDLRVKVSEHLKELHPDAAYVYENDRIIN